jgi:hypothetical protein
LRIGPGSGFRISIAWAGTKSLSRVATASYPQPAKMASWTSPWRGPTPRTLCTSARPDRRDSQRTRQLHRPSERAVFLQFNACWADWRTGG